MVVKERKAGDKRATKKATMGGEGNQGKNEGRRDFNVWFLKLMAIKLNIYYQK
jgi:hypothetical protein